MKQVSYPGVEHKRHPDATPEMAALGCADRRCSYPTDRTIAEEIIAVYQAMKKSRQLSAPSGEWQWIFDTTHREYQAALEAGDATRLVELLQDFFRNDLSFGLVSHATFQALREGDETALREFANATRLDLDTWLEFCDSPPVSSLAIPPVGNPFGIVVEDTLVAPDAPRHSYHARQLARLIGQCGPRPTVLEIGGGYGGVFWYLWNGWNGLPQARRSTGFCYLNCDLEESLFLFYYFVMTGANLLPESQQRVPRVKWAIDGLVRDTDRHEYDLILVPAKRHDAIQCGLDVVYNANSLSEMSREDIEGYFRDIHRSRPRFIFHQNSNYFPWRESSRNHIEVLARDFPIDRESYAEVYRAISPWLGARGRYREYLYLRRDLLNWLDPS